MLGRTFREQRGLLMIAGGLSCVLLAGCAGLSTPPMEKQSIKDMVGQLNSYQQSYYKQYHLVTQDFRQLATTDKTYVPGRINLSAFGPHSDESPCQITRDVILCDNAFEYYKNVRYFWKGNQIQVTADPGKVVSPLDSPDQ